MSNTLGNYNPNIYVQLALIQLEKALGLASRIYRGYDKDPRQPGSVINLRRPSNLTAQDMPITTANSTDLKTDSIAITLDQWKGVQFSLSDQELAYAQSRIIDEHIRPAAVALADKIDQSINAYNKYIPWYFPVTATSGVADLPSLRRRLFDNKVPLNDVHLEVNGEREQYFLSQDAFVLALNSSDGGQTQRSGTMGTKFGFDIFANQNVPLQPAGGNLSNSLGIQLSATVTAGQATLVLTKVGTGTLAGSLKVGDIVQIGQTATTGFGGFAGTGTRNYVVTADATATSDSITVSISPTPKVGEEATASTTAAVKVGVSTKYDNIAFHRNYLALAFAPLPETARTLGAQVSSIADPITGLALRATMWYDGPSAKVYTRLDALWGTAVLDYDLAVRYVS